MSGPVAQWIRHLTTNQGIPGSNPGGVDSFCLRQESNHGVGKRWSVLSSASISE